MCNFKIVSRVCAVAAALIVGFGLAHCALALDVRVDFNEVVTAPTNWNLVTSATVGSSVADLIDFGTGAGTGVSLVIDDDFHDGTSSDPAWSTSPAYRSWIDSQANRDYFWVRTNLGGQIDNPTGGLTLSGLDPAKTYRIEVVGSRQDSSSRNFQATVNGEFSDSLNSDPFNASTNGYTGHQVMTWRQLTAANGEITVALDAAGQHGYLNALRLTEAPAQTVLIDFGDDSLTTPGRWNNITGSTTGGLMALGHKLVGAVDAAGQETNVRVNFLSGFDGGTNTVGLASDAAGFAVTAQRDSVVIQDIAPPAVVQLEGLRPGAAYDVTLFGSREMRVANEYRSAKFTIDGISQNLLNTDNESNAAVFSGAVADQHGHIQIDVGVSQDQWAYLGGIEIAGRFTAKAHHPSLFFDWLQPPLRAPLNSAHCPE